jgi:O-antigen/teichoic acid export membrane protein
MKASTIVLPIVTAMSPVMVARINTIRGEKDSQKEILRLLNNSFGYVMMLAVPATIGLIVIAPRFVPLFFGAEFIPATASLQLLSLLIIIIGTTVFFAQQVLLALGHDKKILIAALSGTVSNFCLNILLVRTYGSLGASIASVIAEIIVAIVTIIFALKVLPVRLNIGSIFQPILAALPIIPVSLFFNHLMKHDTSYLLVMVVTSTILYAGIMTLVFKNEQANQIVHAIVGKIKNVNYKL